MKNFIKKHLLRHPYFFNLIGLIRSKIAHDSPFVRNYLLKRMQSIKAGHANDIRGICIETILTCNANCIMCRHSFEKMTGVMDMDLFKKIIDDCYANDIKFIGMSIYGEPMLDKYFIERVKYLRQYNMEYCFFTNGSLMTDEKARQLIELGGLSLINFSINAYDKDVYKAIVGLDRENTYSNISNFIDLKNKYMPNDMTVSVSYVRCKENYHDFNDFVKFWKKQKGVDRIILTDQKTIPDSCEPNEYAKLPVFSKNLPCVSIWNALNVYYDGRVAPCCGDNSRTLIVGDMHSQSLKDINQSVMMANLCKTHLDDCRKEHPVCSRCHFDGF